jgi:hypothetical protein
MSKFLPRLALTMIEPNREMPTGSPAPNHRLVAVILDPANGWRCESIDLGDPATSRPTSHGKFVVSALGDVDGDGRDELVYGITREDGDCYAFIARPGPDRWRRAALPACWDGVTLIRTIHAADLDGDGRAAVVVGTRENGAVILLRFDADRGTCTQELVASEQYGRGTTNTREVFVADADGDGRLEILVATARADAPKWRSTPGAVLAYRRGKHGWERTVIDEYEGLTHSRMVSVAALDDEGPCIVSSAVGVLDEADALVRPPEVRVHTWRDGTVKTERLATLHGMIKSRSFAVADVDGDGHAEVVVGTRALGGPTQPETALYVFHRDVATQSWVPETIDTSGPLGFHTVATLDIDGDGRAEVIASDDGRGCFKVYRKTDHGWRSEIIYSTDTEIFSSGVHLLQR